MGIVIMLIIIALAAWIVALCTRGAQLDRDAERDWDADDAHYWRAVHAQDENRDAH